MSEHIFQRLLKKLAVTLYVQIWESRLKVTHVDNAGVFDQRPLVAVKADKKGNETVIAVGDEAFGMNGEPGVEVLNPFSHPRTLLSDFLVAEKLLQEAARGLCGSSWLGSASLMIMHPMEKLEGGLTAIEERALQELALGSGARDALVYTGDELVGEKLDFNALKEQQGEGL